MKVSLLLLVAISVTAALAAKKTPSAAASVLKPKREASFGSSYHGPSHKYLPPSPSTSGSGYDFGGSSLGGGSFHGHGGSGGVFTVKGIQSLGHGGSFGPGPKIETYLVRMEHGSGAGAGIGGYKYAGPSGGSSHSTGSFGSGSFGGHSSFSPSSYFPKSGHGYRVHSIVVPMHSSNDGSFSGGYDGIGGFSNDYGGSPSGHGVAFSSGGQGGDGRPHSFGDSFGHQGHSGGSGYQYSPVTNSGPVSDYDSSDHSSLDATLTHGPTIGHGGAPNLGYSYEGPSDSSLLHSGSSPSYAAGHKGLAHYNSYTLAKPHQRHTDIFSSSRSKVPLQAVLGTAHESSDGDLLSNNSLQSDDHLASRYLPPHHQDSDESGFGGASVTPGGSYLPPNKSYGAPHRH